MDDIKENMIYVYDVFTDLYNDKNENGKFQLNPNLLYMYCLLYRRRNYDRFVEISVDTIHHTAGLKFYPSVESKNRKMIKECLVSLKKRGIIHFDDSVDDILFMKKGNTIPIRISFPRFVENGGYSMISYSDFDAAYNIDYLYIRVAVERYNQANTFGGLYKGRWISENEFGQLLGVSKKTFRSYANCMISRGELYKISGERKENLEQDKNIYRTIPFEGVECKRVVKDRKYKNRTLFNTVLGDEQEQWELKEMLEASNWRKKDELNQWMKIEQSDYEIYRVCEDLGICMKKVYECKDAIEKLSCSGEYVGVFEKYEEKYVKDKEKLNIK